MIRVLHVVTIMNRAGLESRLMDIYRNINRDMLQFDFYTNREYEGEYDKEIQSMGGVVYYSAPMKIGRLKNKETEFRNFLMEHKEYSIVHSHINEWSTIFCKAAKQASVPCRIAHSRGSNKSLSFATLYKNIVRIPIKKYATDFFAVSGEAGIHLFGEKAYKENKIKIWPNAIDTEKYHYSKTIRENIRKELKIKDDFVVMHVGNLLHVKNHAFLLCVFQSLKQRISNAKLFLVGEGNQRENIEKWISDNNMKDSVFLLGKRSDVSSLLQAADVFVFPSFHEGFPGAVLEAETSGLPCFISDTITPEVMITDNVVGMSIHDDPSNWASEIIKRMNYNRRDCVEEIKTAGYDIHDLTRRMETFYVQYELTQSR